MNEKLFYPAVFHRADEGGYWISFPDFPDALTQGENMQEAYEMAVDCLGLAITVREDEHVLIPSASDISAIKVKDDEFLVIVEFDALEYKKRTNSRAVKKTLSIPQWLNEAAMKKGINFSQTLQEALMEKI